MKELPKSTAQPTRRRISVFSESVDPSKVRFQSNEMVQKLLVSTFYFIFFLISEIDL